MKLKLLTIFLPLLLLASLHAGSSLPKADISIIYAKKVEFFSDPNFPDKGRLQLLETNRSISQWILDSSVKGHTLSIRDFMRELYIEDRPITFAAEIVYISPKRSFSVPLIISAPYYNRFSNTLTLDYTVLSKAKIRYGFLGRDAQLVIHSPYANDGQMETQASSHQREEAKRSRGGHGCNHGRREILSLMRAQLVYIGQRMRKVSDSYGRGHWK
jgi:hypothetical protein